MATPSPSSPTDTSPPTAATNLAASEILSRVAPVSFPPLTSPMIKIPLRDMTHTTLASKRKSASLAAPSAGVP
jgi:hypothetical protein